MPKSGIKTRTTPQTPAVNAPHEGHPTGARSVERALRLLKALSSHGEFGWRLSDLAAEVGLDHTTCHRMLGCFMGEGFAERRPNDLKYYPGQSLFEMGLAVPQYAVLREHIEPALEELSVRTGCIVSFSLRSGNDLVCAYQKRGGLSLAGMLIRVGTRRSLITSVGGLAMLQRLPADEAARIVSENTQRELCRGGARRLEKLDRMRSRSTEYGFGFTLGENAPGISAIGVPIYSTSGNPFAAVVLTGQDDVLNESTVKELHAVLMQAAVGMEAEAQRWLPNG